MRPAQQSSAPDVWIVREQARTNLQKSLSPRASEPGPSLATVSPKPIRFAASFHPRKGKVYLYVNETLCWKPCFPNYQSGAAADVRSSRDSRISKCRGGPRNWTLTRICVRGDVFERG